MKNKFGKIWILNNWINSISKQNNALVTGEIGFQRIAIMDSHKSHDLPNILQHVLNYVYNIYVLV